MSKKKVDISGLTDTQINVLKAFAKNDMNIAATAAAMYLTRGTVVYHIEQIHDKTGVNPHSFYGLVHLLITIKKKEGIKNAHK